MLTDIAARNAKPGGKPYKLADAKGLYLLVAPTGTKSWRFRYRSADRKEKLLTFGLYPEVKITEARDLRDDARRQVKSGFDPALAKRLLRAGASTGVSHPFKGVACAWHVLNTPRWKAHHAIDVLTSLERDIFPVLGDFDINQITAPMILKALRAVEARGSIEAARRLRQRLSAIFVFGLSSGYNAGDPAAIVLGALAPMKKGGSRPAVVTIGDARKVTATVEAETARPVTKLAHRLLALTAVRPGEVAGAMWREFEQLDGDEPVWRIPAERMKPVDGVAIEFVVPLSRQAVDTIAAIKTLTGGGPVVFANAWHAHKPMSGNAVGYLLISAGFKGIHCPHGWRSTFSTVMNELAERDRRDADRAIIDLMLAHVPPGAIEPIYNRSRYMPRRREIAQAWADLLMIDSAPAATLIDGPRRRANGTGRSRDAQPAG